MSIVGLLFAELIITYIAKNKQIESNAKCISIGIMIIIAIGSIFL